jgi:CheY-like chemotaxis protein
LGGLIAVVEDEPELQALYRLVLKSKGYSVAYVSANAEDAVCKYEHCPVKPDLVIMDRRLENSSGEEAARRICRMHPDARILFATADADLGMLSSQPGVVGVLQKPFSMDTMFRAIEGAIGEDERRVAM